MSWPRRDGFCIDCRSVVPGDDVCPAGHWRVQALAKPPGRELLLADVWGPKPLRQRTREAMRAGAVGGGSYILDSCSALDITDGFSFAGFLVAVVAFAIAWLGVKLIGDAWRKRKHRLLANGARRRPLLLGPATGRIGTIITRDVERPPLGDRACVAYSTQLEQRDTVMLRDAATLGFDVLLDTGEHVRIPAGPIVIDMKRAPRVDDIGNYLRAIDPLREHDAEGFDPFPHDRARVRVLVPGDRVEVLGRLVPIADGAGGGGYREAAHTVLVPDEVPRFRLVNESARPER